ncbi:MAG: thiamine-phosphate kinase [Sneathiella sp.]|nr:thiamine-phosphate kinase [Sneathiella sp.]
MAQDEKNNRPGEFELIADLLAPLAASMPGAFNLTDDAAVLGLDAGMDMVLTKDAMVAGVHFRGKDAPEDVARKLLRVNLSHLAAMGAAPVGYLLATFWPENLPTQWIRDFAGGLKMDQDAFGIGLLGGDTVRTPGPLSLSLTAIGKVPSGKALRRKGAKAGDLVVVSGSIGDGALGLLALDGKLPDLDDKLRQSLADRYHLPSPRLALGAALIGEATACIDISDGLVADIGHICEVSKVAAVIEVEKLPLSKAAAAALAQDPSLILPVLTGGDDYELALTLPPLRESHLGSLARQTGTALTVIGRIEDGNGVRVVKPDGSALPVSQAGWRHF